VHELVDIPEFVPGMGTLYVQPDTLPEGPFLAFDRDGRMVSTIYMLSMEDLESGTHFGSLEATGKPTKSVELHHHDGHAGVAKPHYHVVMWHVEPGQARLD
jgi:hypothetical protein